MAPTLHKLWRDKRLAPKPRVCRRANRAQDRMGTVIMEQCP